MFNKIFRVADGKSSLSTQGPASSEAMEAEIRRLARLCQQQVETFTSHFNHIVLRMFLSITFFFPFVSLKSQQLETQEAVIKNLRSGGGHYSALR
jgi:hypothetical protein